MGVSFRNVWLSFFTLLALIVSNAAAAGDYGQRPECAGSFHDDPTVSIPTQLRFADLGEFVLRMSSETSDADFNYVVDLLETILPSMTEILGSPPLDTLTLVVEPTTRPRHICFLNLIIMGVIHPRAPTNTDRGWDNTFVHELAHAFDGDVFCGVFHSELSWIIEGFAEAARHFVADRVTGTTGRDIKTRYFDRRISVFDLMDFGGAQVYGGPRHVVRRVNSDDTYLLSAGTILIPAYAQIAAGLSTPHPLARLRDALIDEQSNAPHRIYEAIDRAWSSPVDGVSPPSRWIRSRAVTCPEVGDGEFLAILPFRAFDPHNNVNPDLLRVFHFERRNGENHHVGTPKQLRYTDASGGAYYGDPADSVHDVPAGLPAGAYHVEVDVTAGDGGTLSAESWIMVTRVPFHSGPLEKGVAAIFIDETGRPVDLGRDVSVNGRIVARAPGGVIAVSYDGRPTNLTFKRGREIIGTVTTGPLTRVVVLPVKRPAMGTGVVEWSPYHPARGGLLDVSLRLSQSSLDPGAPVTVTLFSTDGSQRDQATMMETGSPDILNATLSVPPDLPHGVLVFEDGSHRHAGCQLWPCEWFFGYEFATDGEPIPRALSAYVDGTFLVMITESPLDPSNLRLLAAASPAGPWAKLPVTPEPAGARVVRWDMEGRLGKGTYLRVIVADDGTILLQQFMAAQPTVQRLVVLPPFPNPTAGPVIFPVEVAAPTAVTMEIYDVLGRLVDRTQRLSLHPGLDTLIWNGLDSQRSVAPGIYFVRINGAGFSSTRKIVVVR